MPELAQSSLDPRRTLTYRLFAGLIGVLSFLWFRPTVEGAENIPMTGAIIIAPIHRTNIN